MKPLLTTQQLLLLGVLYILLLILAPLLSRLLCHLLRLVKPNFAAQRIPAAVGLTYLFVGGACYAALTAATGLVLPGSEAVVGFAPVFLYVTAGFGLLGLVDDLWGHRDVGGFRGHLKALASGRPTTGMLKMVGGGIVALTASWSLHRADWLPLLLDAGVIALAANTLNLLDTRPGRALFGFFLLVSVLLAAVMSQGWAWVQIHPSPAVLIGPLVCAAAVEWWPDARGRAMMGDTGSNLLGAVAGLAAALALPLWGRMVLLAILLTLNMLAERVSLNALIERTSLLRRLDRALGVRSEPGA